MKKAVEINDYRLGQGFTTSPPPLAVTSDWECKQACLVAFPFWEDGLETVGEVEEAFARACYEIDQKMGIPVAVRELLNWYDDGVREEVFSELLREVDLELQRRMK